MIYLFYLFLLRALLESLAAKANGASEGAILTARTLNLNGFTADPWARSGLDIPAPDTPLADE